MSKVNVLVCVCDHRKGLNRVEPCGAEEPLRAPNFTLND